MNSANPIPVLIDSDNAMGAPFGDVDDGFAIAAAIKGGLAVEAISSVHGNTFEPWAFKNHSLLLRACGFDCSLLRGAARWWSGPNEASNFLAGLSRPVRLLALGPMTNIALALRQNAGFAEQVSELVLVATNYSVRLPAFRVFDFNQWKDGRAFSEVVDSRIPLVVVPLDVARALRVSESQVRELPGELGRHLQRHSRRWFLRSLALKGQRSVPIWDLVAVMYALEPELFETVETDLALGRMGEAYYGSGRGRPVRVVTGFDPKPVWEKFLSAVS
jgi:inosine-uridine nucleoside N-ribohydrolase